MNKRIGDTLSINNLSNNFLQRPTFSDVIISTVHHLGNVRNYNSSVKRRSLFFHDFFSVQADKPRDGINLNWYFQLVETWKLQNIRAIECAIHWNRRKRNHFIWGNWKLWQKRYLLQHWRKLSPWTYTYIQRELSFMPSLFSWCHWIEI